MNKACEVPLSSWRPHDSRHSKEGAAGRATKLDLWVTSCNWEGLMNLHIFAQANSFFLDRNVTSPTSVILVVGQLFQNAVHSRVSRPENRHTPLCFSLGWWRGSWVANLNQKAQTNGPLLISSEFVSNTNAEGWWETPWQSCMMPYLLFSFLLVYLLPLSCPYSAILILVSFILHLILTHSQWVSQFWWVSLPHVHKHKYLFFHVIMHLIRYLQRMESNKGYANLCLLICFMFLKPKCKDQLGFLEVSPLKIQIFFFGTWASYLWWSLLPVTAIITYTSVDLQRQNPASYREKGRSYTNISSHWEVTCFLENLRDPLVHVVELHIFRWVDISFHGEEASGWLESCQDSCQRLAKLDISH